MAIKKINLQNVLSWQHLIVIHEVVDYRSELLFQKCWWFDNPEMNQYKVWVNTFTTTRAIAAK